jgi:aminoglycoside phosphotransferase (APT) family kinase protein
MLCGWLFSMSRRGVRTSWDGVPAAIREGAEEVVGARVITATNLAGGFSPGPAARCDLSDGRSVFVKAAGLALNPVSPGMHRREAAVLAAMPSEVPAPRLIGVVDDGDWVALVTEWIDGRMPTAPLSHDDVKRFLRVVDRLAQIAADETLPQCVEAHPSLFGHWQLLAEQPLPGLDEWSHRHLQDLDRLERDVEHAAQGDRLVHLDLRTDNVIFADADEEHDIVVDWPGACRGAPWVDLVCLLPSLELDGAPGCEQVFAEQRVGASANPDDVDALVATLAGYFTRMSLPAPRGLPTVRAFQAAQGEIARRWLAERREWSW